MTSAENTVTAEQTRRAVEQMRRMNSRSKYREDECAKESERVNGGKTPERKTPQSKAQFPAAPGLPFLRDFGIDPDMTLILGLLLILTAESSDKLLLLALLYILV